MGGKRQTPERVKALTIFAAFERFCEVHGKAVPAAIAADYLRITPTGLYNAAERGWIAYFQHTRDRWYSYKDVVRYRWHTSRKFLDVHPRPPYPKGGAKFDWEKLPPAEDMEADIRGRAE